MGCRGGIMTAKEFLSRARHIDERIERRHEELVRLRQRLEAGRSAAISDMPRGGRADWTDSLARVIDIEARINGEILELCRVKEEIIDAINAVHDIRYRTLLEYRYRNYWSWQKIADVMGYDVRWIYRLHGQALRCVKVPGDNTPL